MGVLLFLLLSIFLFLGCFFYMQILSDLPQYVWNGLNNIRFYGKPKTHRNTRVVCKALKETENKTGWHFVFLEISQVEPSSIEYFTYYGLLVSLTFRKKERAVNKILCVFFTDFPYKSYQENLLGSSCRKIQLSIRIQNRPKEKIRRKSNAERKRKERCEQLRSSE